jgi:hypothetical protein
LQLSTPTLAVFHVVEELLLRHQFFLFLLP